MTKKDLLEVEKENMFQPIPLLDIIYVIPTRRKHESGFKQMEIIGEAINNEGETTYIKKLATFSDVFDICEIFTSRHQYFTLSMDIPECGVMRFFSQQNQFRVDHYGISSFCISIVERKNNNE